MRFTKMHGAGNDFIIINNLQEKLPEDCFPTLAARLCTPHTSIGADGFMVVDAPRQGGDYSMLFYNSDGSKGEMCGNGARCIARYGFEKGLAGETQRIEATAGIVVGERITPTRYRIRLNDPTLIDLHRPVSVGGREYDCAYVELGDPAIPHAVLLLPSWEEMDRNELRELGRALRFAKAFPKGANVNFVKLMGADDLKAITFERGVEDFTLACGTGCGSIVTALSLLGLVSGREVRVSMPGGELSVTVTLSDSGAKDLFLTGPTCVVCEGEIPEEAFAN